MRALVHLFFWIVCLPVGLGACDRRTGGEGDPADAGLDSGPDSGLDGAVDGGDGGGAGCDGGPPVHCLLGELTAPYVDPNYTPGKAIGLVVGVAKPGARYVTGFGATTLGGSEVPDASSLFEVASVTKVYTGYLLARGILNGEVRLTDTLEDTFGPAVPTYSGSSIDLLDLVTHTSGLPKLPTNVLYPGEVNPARDYTVSLLEEFLATYTLPVVPGTTYLYSNCGLGILGHVLVTASGEPDYHALVQREIAGSYGLVDTGVALTGDQQARLVQGYHAGVEAPVLDIGAALQGGGAIRATGDEVLRFFEGAISSTDPAWDLVMIPRRSSPNGVDAQTGFSLNVEYPEGVAVYAKMGGSPGFTSLVAFTLEPPTVVVLLSNLKQTQSLYPLAKTIIGELARFTDF